MRPSVILDILTSAESFTTATSDVGVDDDDGGMCDDARGSNAGVAHSPGAAASAIATVLGGPKRGFDGASVRSGATGASTATSSGGLTTHARVQSACSRCGYMTSAGGPGGLLAHRTLCQACTLLAGLEAGTPRVGLTSSRQARKLGYTT